MPYNVSNVPTIQLSYLSGNFKALWGSTDSQLRSNISLDQTTRMISRSQDFVMAIQEKLLMKSHGDRLTPQPLIQLLELIKTEDNAAIKQAMNKQAGYLSRLFSQESWAEWVNERTALGNVICLYADYASSAIKLNTFLTRLDINTLQKANEEAAKLLGSGLMPKIEPPQRSLWRRIGDTIAAIDRKISSLLLPQGVSADFAGSYIPSREDVERQHALEQQKINIEQQKADEAARTQKAADTRKLLAQYNEMYLISLTKYMEDIEKYKTADGYYIDKNDYANVAPRIYTDHLYTGEPGHQRCVREDRVGQGYLRWSIYKSAWGPDGNPVAEGSFNYDIQNKKPTTEERAEFIAPRCK